MRKLKHFSLLFFFSFCITCLFAQSEEYGMASYYGDEFHGGATASGEAYDKNKLTAAHKTLPMGSKVRVTRLDNNKSVVVRINDRGPYLKGRVIDLSGRAASALDMISDGSTEVKLEVVGKKTTKKATSKTVSDPVVPKVETPTKKPTPKVAAKTKETESKPKKTQVPATTSSPVLTAKGKTATANTNKPSKEKAEENTQFELVTPKNYKEYDLYKIDLVRPKKEGYGLQIGSFSDYSNVLKRVTELQAQWFKNILVSIEKGKNGQKVYKLILGPFADQKTATSYKKHAKKNKKINGFVVNLADIK